MEKENVESSDAAAGKRRPKALGSVAIEPEKAGLPVRERHHAAEARWLHTAPPSEQIGHVLISAEAKPTPLATKPLPEKSKAADLAAGLHGQRVDTLNRAELMSLSEQITIDSSSLRQIYETHLIGERGLRRLVAEYLHDGDLKQALRLEVVEREKDFERDPAMRDMVPDQAPTGHAPASSQDATLDELLARAALDSDDGSEEAAFFKARARYEARELHQHKQHRRLIDITLAAIILILLMLVIVLLFSHA